MRRILSVLVICSFSISLFAAGSADNTAGERNGDEKLTIALVVNTSDYQTAGELVGKWAEERGVDVEIIEENTQSYASSYVLASKTKNPNFDLIMFWDFYLDQFYSFLTPLDGSYDPALDLSRINNGDFMEMGISSYKGHPYVFPYGMDAYVYFYREDLMTEAGITEPPSTWDELIDVALKLTKDTDGDGNIDQWGLATNGIPGQVFNTYSFFNLLLTNGGKIVDEDGLPLFNSNEGVEALQLMIDLRNKYEVMPPDVITYDNNEIHEGFLAGKFATILHWPYVYGMTYGSPIEGKVGYTAVPHSQTGQAATVLNSWSFGIPQMSENKELAFELGTYLTSTESGAFEFSKKKDWPFRESAYVEASESYDIPVDFQDFSKFVFDVASTNSQKVIMARGGETSTILGDYIDLAMTGEISAKAALESAVADINKLLE